MSKKIIPILSGIFIIIFSTIAVAGNSLIIIIDSSHFMKASHHGIPKIKMSGEALTRYIDSADESLGMGLAVVGNNKKKGCVNNIYEIPVKVLNVVHKEKIKRIARRLRPVGENSITEAVLKSVQQLRRLPDKKAIVILSGSRETCSFSPCDEISNQVKHLDIPIHTIGISIEDKATKSQFGCISRNAKGTFYPAENTQDIIDALQSIVKELNSNLKVNVNVTTGHPYKGRLKGTLYKFNEENMGMEDVPYQTDIGQPLYFSAIPGSYHLLIENMDNDIHISKEIQDFVIENDTDREFDINLQMGKIQLDIFQSARRNLKSIVNFHVFKADSYEKEFSVTDHLPLHLYLPAGTYDFLVEITGNRYKDEILKKHVAIENGKITYASINLDLGELDSAVYQTGNTLMTGRITTQVYPAGNSETAIFQTTSNPASILLPPGKYDLHVKIDTNGFKKTLTKNNITIETGEKKYEFFDLALGSITATVHASLKDMTVNGARINIYPTDDKNTIISSSTINPSTFLLPPGKYDIQVEFDTKVESRWENGIIISSGISKEVNIQTNFKILEIQFFMPNYEFVNQMVDTYIYLTDSEKSDPVATVIKDPVKVFLPENTYDLKFNLHVKGQIKTYWKRNVIVTRENYQSFNVTFPEAEDDL